MRINERPFVIYWNNVPTPYMVDRFNALADRAPFDFEAWFNDRTTPTHNWSLNDSQWRFRYRYLPVTKLGRLRLRWPLPVFNRRPNLIVSLYAEPVFVFGWMLARCLGIRTAFWCVSTPDSLLVRRRWKNRLKRWMFRRVDATLGPGEEGRAFALSFGTPPEKALLLRHAIDVRHYTEGSVRARPECQQLRIEWGLIGTVFIYVGRLCWGKGLDVLLDAFDQVQRVHPDPVSLFIIGDGPDETKLRNASIKCQLRNVVFSGFRQKLELPKLYALADVFVFPTLGDTYGLVVDEAMATALPVISTSAAGEIRDRIEEGINGFIVPPEDSRVLAARMLQLAQNPTLRQRMGEISAEKIKDHTPERWAADFEQIAQILLTTGA